MAEFSLTLARVMPVKVKLHVDGNPSSLLLLRLNLVFSPSLTSLLVLHKFNQNSKSYLYFSIQLHTAFPFQLYQVRHDKYQHLYLSQTKVRFGNISMDAAGRYITTM